MAQPTNKCRCISAHGKTGKYFETFRKGDIVVDEDLSGACDVYQNRDGLVFDGVLATSESQQTLFKDELNCPTILGHNVRLELKNDHLSRI